MPRLLPVPFAAPSCHRHHSGGVYLYGLHPESADAHPDSCPHFRADPHERADARAGLRARV